ncbi:MAG: hypothetical protein OEY78_01855 [Gammaproteobacteria bacterium]|nr:hypothetical protein [Gammaproteobacteria bacterium]
MNDENNPMDMWRWKMMRKVADYLNQPNDITMSELKAMIESYRNYHNIKELISSTSTSLSNQAQ